MSMADTEAVYKMADVRRLFSNISDTLVNKWDLRGLIDCHKHPGAFRITVRYTAVQLCHIGVLRQMSTFGILNWAEQVMFMTDTGISYLSRPAELVQYYRAHGHRLKIIVVGGEHPIGESGRDRRMRRTKTEFVMMFTPDYETYLNYKSVADRFMLSDQRKVFSHLSIDFDLIALHVYTELGVSDLLQ